MCNSLSFIIEPGPFGRQVIQSMNEMGFHEVSRQTQCFGDLVTFQHHGPSLRDRVTLTNKAIKALAAECEQERFVSERLTEAQGRLAQGDPQYTADNEPDQQAVMHE